jgi:hypothetical protein
MNEVTVRIFARYLKLFNRQKFMWQAAHSLLHREMTDAELRECIDDVTARLREILALNGAPLNQDGHNWLKGELIKKIMGPTKRLF